MKTIYSILFLSFFVSINAQNDFYIATGTSVSIENNGILYSKSNVENLGTIEFTGTTPTGDLYLDGGFDNSTGTLTLGDAVLHIGSGNANSSGSYDFIFNTNDDIAKFVEFNKTSGTATTSATGGLLNITNTFTSNGSGTLEANDHVVLKSTSVSETAIVPESLGGTVNGIRVERFIPADRAFRMMASPVNTDGSIYDNWQNGGVNTANIGTHITGGTIANGFDQNESGLPSMYSYNHTTFDWDVVTNTNDATSTLEVGTPYYILVRGDRSINLQINDPNFTETNLHQTGSLHIGSFSQTFNLGQDEFVAIANPYQAPVDISEVMPLATTQFKDQMWVWSQTDRNSGQFAQVNDLSSSPLSSITGFAETKFLQPGQTIFVQTKIDATASQALNFEEGYKANLGDLVDVFRERSNQQDGFLRLGLYDAKHIAFEDLAYDGFIIQFDNQYSNAVDNFDGEKLFNNRENMGLEIGSKVLSNNKRKLPNKLNEVIDISLYNLKNKDYKFSVDLEGFESLPEGIILWDKYSDTYTSLEDKQVINFTVDSSKDGSADKNRFALVFENTTLGIDNQELADLRVYPNPMTTNYIDIQFSKSSGADTTIELFDLLGKKVMAQKFDNVQSNLRIDNLNLSTGVYLLNVKQDNQSKTFKIIRE